MTRRNATHVFTGARNALGYPQGTDQETHMMGFDQTVGIHPYSGDAAAERNP